MLSLFFWKKKAPDKGKIISRDKKLRLKIAEYKSNGDLKRQKSALKKLHLLRIANIEIFGVNGLERYPAFLLKHGMKAQSEKAERKANDAIKALFKSMRLKRRSQLKGFDLLKFSADTKSPSECQQKDNQIFPNSSALLKEWVNCDHNPRCYCRLHGMNEATARRRKLIP